MSSRLWFKVNKKRCTSYLVPLTAASTRRRSAVLAPWTWRTVTSEEEPLELSVQTERAPDISSVTHWHHHPLPTPAPFSTHWLVQSSPHFENTIPLFSSFITPRFDFPVKGYKWQDLLYIIAPLITQLYPAGPSLTLGPPLLKLILCSGLNIKQVASSAGCISVKHRTHPSIFTTARGQGTQLQSAPVGFAR